MSDVKCPNCSNALVHRELNEGWCNSCGKEVPMFVYHQAGLKGPKGHALPQAQVLAAPAGLDPDEALPIWQLAVIGAIVIGIAVAIVLAFV